MENNIVNSHVKISEDTIASIIELAINEIESVSVFESSFKGKLTGKKPVHIDMNDDSVSIEASINVRYGDCIQDIAPKVQENIKNNLEIMTSLKVSNINLHVMGLI